MFDPPSEGSNMTAHEMRHVVDFFSVTFGLCGLNDDVDCDFTPEVRQELLNWFVNESVTSTWIRATSPMCNCSKTFPVGGTRPPATQLSSQSPPDAMYPAYTTCQAGRPDHGSNGAYPSWPAFAVEAMIYLSGGDCSKAIAIYSTFANNTFEGPFGQAHETPQLSVPPFTPFNDEPAFKPVAGVTRYTAIEGGSFFDAILRGFFGFHAPLAWPTASDPAHAEAILNGMLNNRFSPRGFSGKLNNLRTPFGSATITADAKRGLKMNLL